MKAQSSSRQGWLYNTDPTGVVTLIQRPSTSLSVSCGAMVKGNRVNPNPWKYTVRDVRFLKGTNLWIYTYSGGNDYVTKQEGCIAFDTSHPLFNDMVFPEDLYNDTLSALNERTRGSLDLSIDLAQAGMNARMMNVIGRIREYSFTKSWRTLLRGGAAARLEYVYGWRPLADDLYGILDESQRLCINKIERFRVRKSRQVGGTSGTVNVQFYGAAPVSVNRSGRHLCEISVLLKTKNFDIARWASLNPVSWIYELTPYSFVLDWMIDVGGYIRNLETSLLYGNSFVSGYTTRVSACDASGTVSTSRSVSGRPTYKYIVDGAMSGRYVNFDRSILTSYPLPRLPTFKADLGSGRLLNLASLLAQRIEGAKPVRSPRKP